MTNIDDLIATLRLLRRFGDSPEVVGILDKTLAELERLQEVERHAGNLAREAIQQASIDRNAAQAILRLIEPRR